MINKKDTLIVRVLMARRMLSPEDRLSLDKKIYSVSPAIRSVNSKLTEGKARC